MAGIKNKEAQKRKVSDEMVFPSFTAAVSASDIRPYITMNCTGFSGD